MSLFGLYLGARRIGANDLADEIKREIEKQGLVTVSSLRALMKLSPKKQGLSAEQTLALLAEIEETTRRENEARETN